MSDINNTKRAAIILDRTLAQGPAANAAAIVLGQLARNNAALYEGPSILDADTIGHASIQWNVVVLKAKSPIQISNTVRHISENGSDLDLTVFSNWGRTVSNGYDDYKSHIVKTALDELSPIAFGLYGDAERVRFFTKKFSYYN